MMNYCKSLVVKARPTLKNRMRFQFSKRKTTVFWMIGQHYALK